MNWTQLCGSQQVDEPHATQPSGSGAESVGPFPSTFASPDGAPSRVLDSGEAPSPPPSTAHELPSHPTTSSSRPLMLAQPVALSVTTAKSEARSGSARMAA